MKKSYGFSLIELFVALAIGLVLFSGVMSIFVGMRTTSEETSSYGGMQETGRFVISLLTDDLMRQGFFGDFMIPISASNLRQLMVAPAGECTGDGLNNGTFPNTAGNYRTLWGTTAVNANNMGCIASAKIGSDILQLKRTITSPQINPQLSTRYYLYSNATEGEIIVGQSIAPVINDARVHEYQHHVYYVEDESMGSETVPVLKMIRLATTMSEQPLVDGVERIRFLYGVDSDLDGVVNMFLTADEMNASGGNTGRLWDNANSRIIAVKMYVLIRDIQQDPSYTNSNDYYLGFDANAKYSAPSDNYRRMLFSSTVNLLNGDVKVWN